MTRAAKTTATDTPTATTETTASSPKKRGRPPGSKSTKSTLVRGSDEARHKAYLIIEALSGLRSPSEASALIGVTINRYYQLETRGLQGLVEALEARPAGRQPSPEAEAKRLERERERLERELRRAHALVRVAQRAVGLPAQATRDPPKGDGKKVRRRPRNRTARTLARLRPPTQPSTDPAGPAPPAT